MWLVLDCQYVHEHTPLELDQLHIQDKTVLFNGQEL